MLGISVYLQDLDIEYIKKASEIGVKYVFTSLHIPEEDYSDIELKLPLLLKACTDYQLDLVPDVSPVTFEKLGVAFGDFSALKKLGLNTLRLDFGFDHITDVKKLQTQFELFLNASTVDEDYLKSAQVAGVDLSRIKAAHNFYPKSNTGLSTREFIRKNQLFQKYQIDILAFVPGDQLKRFPLYEGLPTLEIHRGWNSFVAAVDLMVNYGVKDIIVGDSFSKISTLKKIQRFMDENVLCLPANIDKSYGLYEKNLDVRNDLSEYVIRIGSMGAPRLADVPIEKTGNRIAGTITMENRLSGRYSGEIQISKIDLPFSKESNIIGFVYPEYLKLLDMIQSETQIVFERK